MKETLGQHLEGAVSAEGLGRGQSSPSVSDPGRQSQPCKGQNPLGLSHKGSNPALTAPGAPRSLPKGWIIHGNILEEGPLI